MDTVGGGFGRNGLLIFFIRFERWYLDPPLPLSFHAGQLLASMTPSFRIGVDLQNEWCWFFSFSSRPFRAIGFRLGFSQGSSYHLQFVPMISVLIFVRVPVFMICLRSWMGVHIGLHYHGWGLPFWFYLSYLGSCRRGVGVHYRFFFSSSSSSSPPPPPSLSSSFSTAQCQLWLLSIFFSAADIFRERTALLVGDGVS